MDRDIALDQAYDYCVVMAGTDCLKSNLEAKPSFLMVLTGVGSIAYRRPEDGIYVVPTGCLKP